jgi:hypothetical protein
VDILKNTFVVGIGAVLAATVLVPALIPAVSTAGRPLAKSLLKGGMMLYEKGREAVAIAGETIEDMMAEIRAEEAALRAPDGGARQQPAMTSAPPGSKPAPTVSGSQGTAAAPGAAGMTPNGSAGI